jgi:predicted RNA-binding protein with PUA-like domain
MQEKKYWLLKTEPRSYSIEDFEQDKVTSWTGVRNYQARNFIKEMKKGETFLFYHSGKTPGVVGLGQIIKPAYADPTQFDRKDSHYDPKSTKEKPIWYTVDVKFVKKFKNPVLLSEIKNNPILKNMPVTMRGSRLSVQPALKKHINFFIKKAKFLLVVS